MDINVKAFGLEPAEGEKFVDDTLDELTNGKGDDEDEQLHEQPADSAHATVSE